MRPRIVYVHGSGPKQRAELLRSQWDRALFGRDVGDTSQLAYWAPVLHPEPLPDTFPDPLEGRPRAVAAAEAEDEAETPAHPLLEDPAQFVARTAAEAKAVRGAAGESVRDRAGGAVLGGWLRDMTYLAEALALAEEPHPGRGEEPLPRALPLPRPARTAMFRLLVRHIFEDVHAYFFGGAGPAVRQVVSDALDATEAARERDGGGPLVVVGHSLGSVVAYEVLAARNTRVDLFVTLGSPLAVTEVRDCLAAPPAVPDGTALWLNASDARDLVALDHTLRPEYAPPGRITDLLVSNGSANHHGIAEYLADPLVQEPVRRVFSRIA
ncbi:serine aminopeptidase domain-containing protein [Streptomyces sp. TRM49041]|uniref:serine aminopeptidase domain-containing protein n=1 Tax=Streptomyces sp. TRM49041 TaxID=2603216 RepID=UPI0011ED997D|nr:alpha/beta hydrolase [Streptomyces sp. TRM49041]